MTQTPENGGRDLVKRLRSWPVTRAQNDLWDAAEHIEKLEALLSMAVDEEAALPAVYRLALADASQIVSQAGHSLHVEIDCLPTPTAAELMARLKGQTDGNI